MAVRRSDKDSIEAGDTTVQVARPPTSTDVARLAKVSQSTVSHVLNDVPNSRFTPETRERVLAAAEQLGYVPHASARSLRFGHSNLVLIPAFDWPFNPDSYDFLQRLASHLDALGYTVLMELGSSKLRSDAARTWASLRPIGVFAPLESITEEIIDALYRAGTRAVLALGTSPSTLVPTLLTDFTPLGRCAAEHLISRGHRHLAAIVTRDPRILPLGLQRLAGMEQVARAHGVQVDRVDMAYNVEDAAQIAAAWQRGPRPTGVFTFNDEYGALLMGALQDVGLSIPGDIALVGCDNLPVCEAVRPRLTSTRMPTEPTILSTAQYFDALMQGRKNAVPPPPYASGQVDLIIRESS